MIHIYKGIEYYNSGTINAFNTDSSDIIIIHNIIFDDIQGDSTAKDSAKAKIKKALLTQGIHKYQPIILVDENYSLKLYYKLKKDDFSPNSSLKFNIII